MRTQNLNLLTKILLSCTTILLYIGIMYLTQSFSFGKYQVRIATSLYIFSYFYSFLICPLALANLISNALMGGLGILDMVGGFAVGLLTTYTITLIQKNQYNYLWTALPIVIIPGLGVAIWLSPLLDIPYFPLAVSISIGQIVPATAATLLIDMVKFLNVKMKKDSYSENKRV